MLTVDGSPDKISIFPLLHMAPISFATSDGGFEGGDAPVMLSEKCCIGTMERVVSAAAAS